MTRYRDFRRGFNLLNEAGAEGASTNPLSMFYILLVCTVTSGAVVSEMAEPIGGSSGSGDNGAHTVVLCSPRKAPNEALSAAIYTIGTLKAK
jgi:hypothetical protein